jgi:hypothetical protein
VVEEFQDRYGDSHSGSGRFVGGAAEQGGEGSPPSCGPGFASCPTRTQATGWPFISWELAQVAPLRPCGLDACGWDDDLLCDPALLCRQKQHKHLIFSNPSAQSKPNQFIFPPKPNYNLASSLAGASACFAPLR